jgi:HAMP domain-containing protein
MPTRRCLFGLDEVENKMKFRDIRMGSKLLGLVGLLCLVLTLVGVLGLVNISATNQALHATYEDGVKLTAQVTEIQNLLLSNRLALARALITPTPEAITASTAEVEQNISRISSVWAALEPRLSGPELVTLAQAFADSRKRFVQEGLLTAVRALRANDLALAQRIVVTQIHPLYEPVGSNINAILKHALDTSQQGDVDASARYQQTRLGFMVLIALSLVLALGMGLWLIRSITRPMGVALAFAQDVAAGRLNGQIPVHGGDEAGQMLDAMEQMQTVLKQFQSAQTEMANKHAHGLISHAMPARDLPGSYGDLALAVNDMVKSHIDLNAQALNLMAQFATGDFSRQMPELPAEKTPHDRGGEHRARHLAGRAIGGRIEPAHPHCAGQGERAGAYCRRSRVHHLHQRGAARHSAARPRWFRKANQRF